jgi:biopolymer transport protein ExbD
MRPSLAGKANLSSTQVMIRLKRAGPDSPTQLLLNSRVVSTEQLSGALQAEFERRSDRIVYIQADPNLSWNEAVAIIDLIRETHAKIVLLTATERAAKVR